MYGIEDKLIAIILSILMLIQAIAIRFAFGTFIIPAALFSFGWFLFTFIPLILLFQAPINSLAVLYIFLCTLMFSFSSLPFKWKKAYKISNFYKPYFAPKLNSKFIRGSLSISVILSILCSILTMVQNGWSLRSVFFNLLATSGHFAALRGHASVIYGIYGTISTFFTYIAPVLGGFVSFSQKSNLKKFGYFIYSMIPAIFTMIVQSSKLVFLVAFSFYIASILLIKIYNSKIELFNHKIISRIFLLLVLFPPLIIISFISREHYAGLNLGKMIRLLKYEITSYLFGQIYAFSDFFSFYLHMPSKLVYVNEFNSYGVFSFASIFSLFGYQKEFPPGMYLEAASLKYVFKTNIYTFFRGIIYDFGGVGSLIFMFIFGFILHSFFFRLLQKQKSWFSCVIFIAGIVFMIMSYLISVFVARYMYLNALGIYFILLINSKITKNKFKQIEN